MLQHEPEADPTTDPVEIQIKAGDVPRMVSEALVALKADPNLYVRSGGLVTVAREPERGDYQGDQRQGVEILLRPGTPKICPVLFPTLFERLAKVAVWKRAKVNQDGEITWTRTNPDHMTTSIVHARPERPGLRPLDSLTEAPYLRADGAVIQRPGYDPASACLYLPNATFPPIPEEPTQEDAARALAALREVFCDFPFREGPDSDVPIAAILTLLARPAIHGSIPMFLFDASTRGSGKSLLTDCIAGITVGRGAPRMSWPTEDEELEKVLSSYALRGPSSIVFDNVTVPIGGASLDKVLTATDLVDLRVLGKSEILSLPWRAVIMATGNNLETKGDTERRCLVARLEPRVENPEDRESFAHPHLLEWVAEERPRLVAAALTILRAYVLAGRPAVGVRSWGSFEAWTALVPAAIVWASGKDVLATRPSVRENRDPTHIALGAVLEYWSKLPEAGEGVTIRAALAHLYPPERFGEKAPPDGFDILREALETLAPFRNGRPGVDPNRLGYKFRHMRGRWRAEKCLQSVEGRAGIARWRVRTTEEDAERDAETWDRSRY